MIRADGTSFNVTRDVTIPKSEWFYVGVSRSQLRALHRRRRGWRRRHLQHRPPLGLRQGHDGHRADRSPPQVDSGEDDIDDLFSNILNKDPNAILNRLDPDLAYPTYGDDSTLVIDAPTSGGFYLKVEKNGNFGLWGDFKSVTEGTELLRNERTLYGAQTVLQTQAVNDDGAPRLRFEGYAAQPDQLPQRDVLRGTGGSVYFLTKQDILIGSETLTVELRDANTQRVISRTSLVQGKDYDINYTQGVVTLYSPLSGYGSTGALLSSNPNGDDTLNLVAQYEWRPAVGDIDGYAYGARLTSGIADNLQIRRDSTDRQLRHRGPDGLRRRSGLDEKRPHLSDGRNRADRRAGLWLPVLVQRRPHRRVRPRRPTAAARPIRIEGQAALDEVWAGGAGLVSGPISKASRRVSRRSTGR